MPLSSLCTQLMIHYTTAFLNVASLELNRKDTKLRQFGKKLPTINKMSMDTTAGVTIIIKPHKVNNRINGRIKSPKQTTQRLINNINSAAALCPSKI